MPVARAVSSARRAVARLSPSEPKPAAELTRSVAVPESPAVSATLVSSSSSLSDAPEAKAAITAVWPWKSASRKSCDSAIGGILGMQSCRGEVALGPERRRTRIGVHARPRIGWRVAKRAEHRGRPATPVLDRDREYIRFAGCGDLDRYAVTSDRDRAVIDRKVKHRLALAEWAPREAQVEPGAAAAIVVMRLVEAVRGRARRIGVDAVDLQPDLGRRRPYQASHPTVADRQAFLAAAGRLGIMEIGQGDAVADRLAGFVGCGRGEAHCREPAGGDARGLEEGPAGNGDRHCATAAAWRGRRAAPRARRSGRC
jgi:hypothetical protein